jgi:hypothetical protein
VVSVSCLMSLRNTGFKFWERDHLDLGSVDLGSVDLGSVDLL